MLFWKMQGCGNDYVVSEGCEMARNKMIASGEDGMANLVRRLCDRHYGIGADGVVFVGKGRTADFEMTMYNPDGSRGEMCGNGIRCAGKYVRDRGMTLKKQFTIESMGAIKKMEALEETKECSFFRVDMGRALMRGELRYGTFEMTCVSMGNPHAVLFPKDWEGCEVERWGRGIETAPCFPNRTNVEFVKVQDRRHLLLRVWERGAGETLACGTGACAAAAVCMQKGLTDDEITVTLLGGELSVSAQKDTGHLMLAGPAVTVFKGNVEMGQ